MSYFNTIEAAEAVLGSVMLAYTRATLLHQHNTAVIVGSMKGMERYIDEVGSNEITEGVKVEYASVVAIVKLRYSELDHMLKMINDLKIPNMLEVDTDKITNTFMELITKVSDKVYTSMKVGRPSDVSKKIMDMIDQNKDRMGLDMEDTGE